MELSHFLDRHAPVAPVPGNPSLVAHQASDVYAVWEAWEADTGERLSRPPMWAAVWPGAVLLARYLSSSPGEVAGARVLELGCGGAVAAVAALRAGAVSAVANDVDPVALAVAALNAAHNGVHLETDPRDRVGAGDLPHLQQAANSDLVLIADFFYERGASARLLELLRAMPARVLIADGGRTFAPKEGVRVVAEDDIPVDPSLEGVGVRATRVLELCR